MIREHAKSLRERTSTEYDVGSYLGGGVPTQGCNGAMHQKDKKQCSSNQYKTKNRPFYLG